MSKPETNPNKKKQQVPKTEVKGRPTKFQPEIKEKILQGIRLGLSMVKACNIAGIDFNTFRNWETKARIEKLPAYIAFFQQCDMAKDEREAFHLTQIVNASRDGTWQASAWFLERSIPEQYCIKTRMELTGRDGGPIEHGVKVTNTADILNSLEIITIQANEGQMAANKLTDGTQESQGTSAPNNE